MVDVARFGHIRRVVVGVVAVILLLLDQAAARTALAEGSQSGSPWASGAPEKRAVEAEDAQRHQQLSDVASSPEASAAVVASKEADAARMSQVLGADSSEQPWPTGIFADGEAPAPGSVFLGTSRWVGVIDGHTVAVYAGSAGEDPSLGRVLVATAGPDMDLASSYSVDLPGAGALRVIAAKGNLLVTRDSKGANHTFDVAAGRFR
jgi:hypothetical protein